jgi:hypothetical protein
LTLTVGRYSKVESLARFGKVTMWIGGIDDQKWTFEGRIELNEGMRTTLLLGTEAAVVELKELKCENSTRSYHCNYLLSDVRSGTAFKLNLEHAQEVNGKVQPADIRFRERLGSPSSLIFEGNNNEEITRVFHHLQHVGENNNNNRLLRVGSKQWPNTYRIESGNWHVDGSGGQNEHFLLVPGAMGYFKGGGGESTLILIGDNSTSGVPVKLEVNPRGNNVNGGTVGIRGMGRIIGRKGLRETIVLNLVEKKVDCDNDGGSNMLNIAGGGGGSNSSEFDLIQINGGKGEVGDCGGFELTIVAEGNTRIEGDLVGLSRNLSLIAFIVPDAEGDFIFQSELNVSREETILIASTFAFQVKMERLENVVLLMEEGSSLRIGLNFSGNESASIVFKGNSSTVNSPKMFFVNEGNDVVAELKVDLHSGSSSAYLIHQLSSTNVDLGSTSSSRSWLGSRGVANVFQLEGGRWIVTGGRQNDTFLLRSEEFLGGLIDGGSGIMNSLVISPEFYENETITVDLMFGELLVGNERIIGLREINSITGREGLPEVILVGSDTSFVSSGGGNATDFDRIIISGVIEGYKEVTFNILEYTELDNVGGAVGSFQYVVNSEKVKLNIGGPLGENSQHFVQFRMELDKIGKVEFDEKNGSILFEMGEFQSSFHLSAGEHSPEDDSDFLQPRFQLVESIETNETIVRLIECDIRVKIDGRIYTSITFKGEGQLQKGIGGIPGAENNFVVSLSNSTVLESLVGHEKSDNFWIASAGSILLLDGGEDGNFNEEQQNSLHLMDSFAPGLDLLVDLAPFGLDGSIAGIVYGSGEDEEEYGGIEVIPTLRNIHKFRGRVGLREKVFAACDTTYLEEVEEIVISDGDCPIYNLAMKINNQTQVSFEGDFYNANDSTSSWAGSFQYRFNGIFSFDIDIFPSTLVQTLSSNTSHTFVFDFDIEALDSLRFLNDSILQYSIGNETFSHQMLFPLEATDEFYTNPQFLTQDGFRIQVTRYGEIVLTLVNPWPTEGKLDLEETIQPSVVPALQGIANKLEVSVIVRTDEDLFMVGYNISEDAQDDERNVLTNGPMRSHLLGGGSGRTMYEIVSLDEDIFIYSGFDGSNPLARQIIDMTDLVGVVRLVTKTKYVPTVGREGPNLYISMTGYEEDYKGRIWLMDGVAYASQFVLQLNSAMMEILPLTDGSKLRRKRSIETEDEWKISPLPLIVPLGFVYTVSAEDLEEGQDILLQPEDGDYGDNDMMMGSNSEFKMVRNGFDMIMTNMGGNISAKGSENLTSFVVADFYLQREDRKELDQFHNVKVHLSQNSSLVLNGTHVFRLSEEAENELRMDDDNETSLLLEGLVNPVEAEAIQWREFLQEVETEMLAEVPEVRTRRYVILPPTDLTDIWVNLFWGGFAVLGVIGFLFSFVCLRLSRREGFYELRSNQKREMGEMREMKEMLGNKRLGEEEGEIATEFSKNDPLLMTLTRKSSV